MIAIDHWQEIFETLRRNKMRTALTSLSVAWGILMLILLLGAGKGLENQVKENFKDDAVNSIWIRPGQATTPFEGLPPGRKIRFTNADLEAVKGIKGVEHISGRLRLSGSDFTIAANAKTASFSVRSVHPGHRFLEKTIITTGRFLNELDIAEHRKVTVIGRPIAEFFFGKGNEKAAIGEYLAVKGIQFRIVGVFIDEGGEGELQKVYLPISTAQRAFNAQGRVDLILFTVGNADLETSQRIEAETRELLASRLRFSPDDPRALRVTNNLEEFHKISQIFLIIRFFLWGVGIGTIIASIIGVSNIMLISVAERRVEIGVRKALGATPWAIVTMILKESMLVTVLAGYLGLTIGVGLLELVNTTMADNEYIVNPEVDLRVAVGAMLVLAAGGMLAGYIPARRAAKVNPIVALRDQ